MGLPAAAHKFGRAGQVLRRRRARQLSIAATQAPSRQLLGDPAHRSWAARVLGATWVVGTAVIVLLANGSMDPPGVLLTLATVLVGVALLVAPHVVAPLLAFDVLLLATTALLGAWAWLLPDQRQVLAGCSVWAVPLAFALLPFRRALLQVAFVALVAAPVAMGSMTEGDPASGMIQWLLVTGAVVAVSVVMRRLGSIQHSRTVVAEAVADLGHEALRAAEPDELLREALRVAVDLTGAEYGTALRRLPDGEVAVAAELGPDPVAPGTVLLLASTGSYARSVLESGEPFIAEDLRHDPRITAPALLVSRGVVSGLAVPVRGATEPLGVLALHFTRRRRFSSDEVAAATSLASVVATAWEQAAQREVISHQAMHDGLTGLANRALFLDRLELALSRRPAGATQADQHGVAVMLIDLDGFKAINDTLGHHAGDRVLVSAAERFRDAVRPQDTVARLGGDEFAVLCEQTPDPHAAARVARRVQAAAAAEPLVMDGAVVTVSASVGLAIAKLPVPAGTDAGSLLREADTALYTAKQQGRARFQLFDEGLQVLARRRLELESDLRQGLDSGQFVLHYQPIRDAVDQRVLGVEALVRWNHPQRGLLFPQDFVPDAERTGLIVPLGQWVLNTACTQAARWQQSPGAHGEPLFIAVNVSPRQLEDPDLPGVVAAALARSGVPAHTLSLEITETALLDEADGGSKALEMLSATGARLVLDDFGTGYSSLTHLTRYPIEAVKVDSSFVAGLGTSARETAVVSAVIALGAELGVKVVAEGVETAEQLSLLMSTGCYGVQGYLLDRPAPALSLDLVGSR